MRLLILAMLVTCRSTVVAGDVAIIPDGDQLAQAESRIYSVYARDIKEASSQQASRALASRLLKTGGEEQEPVTRYALFQIARREAVEADDAVLGYQITEAIVKGFGMRPADNLTHDQWISRGNSIRNKAKKETKKTSKLADKLLAAECYMRAHPNATGLDKAETDKRIEELGIVGSSSDRKMVLGTWSVAIGEKYHASWTFFPDGTVTRTGDSVVGVWACEPHQIKISWKNSGDAWESFVRPIDPRGSLVNSWTGNATIRARKLR